MPRGKKVALDQEILELDSKIEKLQMRLSDLKSRKKELLEIKEKEEFDVLYQLVKESGLTPIDIINKVKTTA